MIALDAHPSQAWPVETPAGTLLIRALSGPEMRAAADAAKATAPLDQYGQIIHTRLRLESGQRGIDLRRIAMEAASLANDCAHADPIQAMEALGVANDARLAMERHQREGLACAEALLRESDQVAAHALDRFDAYLTEPHRQVAARAIVSWPDRLKPGFTVADALDAMGPTATDPTGFDGAAVALRIRDSLVGRALGERGKGPSARPSSSAGATKGAPRSSPKGRSTARTATRRKTRKGAR